MSCWTRSPQKKNYLLLPDTLITENHQYAVLNQMNKTETITVYFGVFPQTIREIPRKTFSHIFDILKADIIWQHGLKTANVNVCKLQIR